MCHCHCPHLTKGTVVSMAAILGSSVLMMMRGVFSVCAMGSAGVYRAATLGGKVRVKVEMKKVAGGVVVVVVESGGGALICKAD